MAKLLIVDDDKVNTLFMKEVLLKSHPDFEIATAFNGEEALDLIRADAPDILLLDVLMPNIDGYEVCRILKEDDELRNIPVLLITGLDATEEIVKGFKSGAADYITKPINVDELIARVGAHLRIKQYQYELVRTQAALAESAKMSAVGSLSAGVAHEFNNILVMMSGYVQLYRASENVEELHKTMGIIGDLVGRGEKIVKGLLDFSRREEFQHKERSDLKELIEQNIALIDSELKRNEVIVELFLADDVPLINCYPGQIAQVIVNILRNAIDAVKDARRKAISITLEKDDRAYELCPVLAEKSCEAYIVLTVIDSGSGIPEDIVGKIFEPFVTTKGVVGGGNESKPGTGLGLSLSYGIMQRHNGLIVADNVRTGGARFRIIFPIE